MKTVTIGGVLEGTYTYNGLEQLAVRDLPTAAPARIVHSIYDGKGNLIAEADGATGATVREYVWFEEQPWLDDSSGLPDSMPLAVVADVDTASPVLWYIHADHLKRPIAVTDTAGTPVSEAWLPFGDTPGTSVVGARFPGQWFQSENGLHYNWHRHYDPTTGCYTQADPLGFVDGPSRYAYALNSPQMLTGPTGLAACGGLCIAGLAYAGCEAASFLYDLYNLADTLTDSCSSAPDIAIASGGLALGAIAPGGGDCSGLKGLRSLGRPNTVPEHGTIFVDSKGNAIVTRPGGGITGSPDGRYIQGMDATDRLTGTRIDSGHLPSTHADPRAQHPYGHVLGVTNSDGTPWLPIR